MAAASRTRHAERRTRCQVAQNERREPFNRGLLEGAMRRAFELARRGPACNENPQVGCVLLAPNGVIVAEGWLVLAPRTPRSSRFAPCQPSGAVASSR